MTDTAATLLLIGAIVLTALSFGWVLINVLTPSMPHIEYDDDDQPYTTTRAPTLRDVWLRFRVGVRARVLLVRWWFAGIEWPLWVSAKRLRTRLDAQRATYEAQLARERAANVTERDMLYRQCQRLSYLRFDRHGHDHFSMTLQFDPALLFGDETMRRAVADGLASHMRGELLASRFLESPIQRDRREQRERFARETPATGGAGPAPLGVRLDV